MGEVASRLNVALRGRYHIRREIGRGGMATVYLADDLRHGRQVALKVLDPELAAVVGADRFLAEIRTTASLQHPYILPLFDSGEADGFLFYVMPYVEGESLRDRLDRDHQLPVDDAVRLVGKLADALDYAHRHGVVHRDIKPGNVLLHDGEPVLVDFGIALATESARGQRLTETGRSLGTPQYMSPEQATGDQHVGPSTDIYSLGCVLYEMLVGEPPFTGSTPQAILSRIVTAESPSAAEERSSVPDHVDGVIRKALEKLPADRFRGAEELAAALHDPGFHHRSVPSSGQQGPTFFQVRWIALVALFAAIAMAGSWLLLRGTSAVGAGPAITSVAVLPFTNIGGEDANQYFADGLAEELLSTLSKVEGLKVAARTSAFVFRGQDRDVREIGDALGVEALIEGSIREQNDRIRISVQIVQVEDGFTLWSDRYEGGRGDLFALQDSVALRIADELQVTLGIEGLTRRERGLTDDPEAHDAYLLGRSHWAARSDSESIRRVIDYYEDAVESDPDFALAYSGLAEAYLVLRLYDPDVGRAVAYREARDAAERALALSPAEPEVLAAAGYVAYWVDWDFARASELLDRAVALGPSYVWGYHNRALLYMSLGRYREALRDQRRAHELDPLSPVVPYNQGFLLSSLDSIGAALPLLEHPASSPRAAAHWLSEYALLLAKMGRFSESGETWVRWAHTLGYADSVRALELWNGYPNRSAPRRSPLEIWNESEEIRAWSGQWGAFLDEVAAETPWTSVDFLYAYAWAGPDAFIQVAEEAVEQRSVWTLFLNLPHVYRPLWSDRRYRGLLERVGLPPPELR